MIRSPNDMDPPDYVTGDFPEEALYEAIYDKFPWVDDEDAHPELAELIAFVIQEAHKQGREDADRDAGEYIHYLENKILELENLE